MAFEKNIYEIYSEKHNMKALVVEYHVKTELRFTYDNQEHVVAIKVPAFGKEAETIEEYSLTILESCIEKLLLTDPKGRKTKLHYWHICEEGSPDAPYMTVHGIVSGHKKLQDATHIHTSEIQWMSVNEDSGEAVICTKNTEYHCPLGYCNFSKQDLLPHLIPGYERIKERFQEKQLTPTIKDDCVLLVLSNFDNYYFNSLYYKKSGEYEPKRYCAYAHVGMFQDSFLIQTDDYSVDIRYFPHYQNIELYNEESDGKPIFVRNIGDVTLYVDSSEGLINLLPGEEKKVCAEMSEEEEDLVLPNGDLYPAGIMEPKAETIGVLKEHHQGKEK